MPNALSKWASEVSPRGPMTNAGVGEQNVYVALLSSFTVAYSMSRSAWLGDVPLYTGDAFAYSPDYRIEFALAATGDEHICASSTNRWAVTRAMPLFPPVMTQLFLPVFYGIRIVTVDFKFAKAEKETSGPDIY